MKNIGIIKCKMTDSYNGLCPGRSCFSAVKLKSGKFSIYTDDIQITAFGHCGGCPGRNASKVADIMKREADVDVIHISSCSYFSQPACPYLEDIVNSIKSITKLPVVVGTHSRDDCKLSPRESLPSD